MILISCLHLLDGQPPFLTISDDDADFPCRAMMAHYFHHLTMVNKQIFMGVAIIYTKFTKETWNNYWLYGYGRTDPRRILSSILQFIYFVLNWFCIKYQYQLPFNLRPFTPFNLLLHNIVMAIDPINVLHRFVIPGTQFGRKILLYHLHHDVIILGPELINNQWRPTLSIINFGLVVIRISVGLIQTQMDTKIVPFFTTLASCFWMYHLCKLYFDPYVAPALN